MGMKSNIAVGLALVVAGAAARLAVRDIPNFAPIAALALFAGYLFADRRWAVWVPLGAMAASDTIIGGYDLRLMAIVYASLAAPTLWGPALRSALPIGRSGGSWGSVAALVGCGLGGSLLFFATTNFAVWALGDMYEHSWQGLVHCYARALPFFRYTLAGDLVFSACLFGGFAVLHRFVARSSDEPESKLVRP